MAVWSQPSASPFLIHSEVSLVAAWSQPSGFLDAKQTTREYDCQERITISNLFKEFSIIVSHLGSKRIHNFIYHISELNEISFWVKKKKTDQEHTRMGVQNSLRLIICNSESMKCAYPKDPNQSIVMLKRERDN